MKQLFLFLLFVPAFGFSQRDYSKMHISHSELAPNIHRLFVGDVVTVIAYTGNDGLLLIDAAYEQTTIQLRDTLKRITNKPVRYVINTHLHADHTGGNIEMGKDADIISHHSVKDWLASDRKQGDLVPGPFPAHAIPNITFEGTMNLDFNGQILNMYHLPEGHTAGDVIVYFSGSNVLVLGDLLFADNFPYVDIGKGGNPMGFIKNLHWVTNRFPADAIVIGGHGPVYNMSRLKTYLATLEETINRVAKAKKDGLTAEQMKESRILAQWENFGHFFITENRWIDTLYPFITNE